MRDIAELMRAANPVPDPAGALTDDELDALLLLTQTRSGNMDTKQLQTPVEPGKKRYRGLLVAAAVFASVLVVGGGIALITNRSDPGGGVGDEPSTTTDATTTTEAALAPETAVDAVLTANEARNRGDIDAYKAALTPKAADDEATSNLSQAMSYANATRELDGCRVIGNASVVAGAGAVVVECSFTSRDDFYGAGGILESGTATFVVTADGKISEGETESRQAETPWEESDMGMFNATFFSWLEGAHPAVFARIQPEGFEPANIPGLSFFPGDTRDPAEMLIALEYVAEFVAQSDVYPLSP